MKFNNMMIVTPSMGGVIKSATTASLMKLSKSLHDKGVKFDFGNTDGSDITIVRNMYATLLYNSDIYDSLLFIDSDISFEPETVLKLIENGADMSGAVYPYKEYAFDKLQENLLSLLKSRGPVNHKSLIAATLKYVCKIRWDENESSTLKPENGFLNVAALGMGLFLIHKNALKMMVSSNVSSLKRNPLNNKEMTYDFFNHVEWNNGFLSEDYSLCYKWTKLMGMKLPALIDHQIGHVGAEKFTGNFLEKLQFNKFKNIQNKNGAKIS